jgi:D-lactate dehydrogenase
MLQYPYKEFVEAIGTVVPKEDIITDPFRTSVYGTDASFYRLVPQVVISIENEDQVRVILREAGKRQLPITFRAAGTSLSGQAITDSILVRLGRGWSDYKIFDNAEKIEIGPGMIGGHANLLLAEFNKKIGPDPASIDCAKIGGILANNASGMCCGVEQNSYQTLDSLRVILVDGTVLDTSDDKSKARFRKSHGALLSGLAALRHKVLADQALAEKIRQKFKIKNTTGYSLNALVDFADPLAILAHLMVGSEGTLGFISKVVYRTVVEHPYKATALILFGDMHTACSAIPILRGSGHAAAAELIDRAGLASVADKKGLPPYLKGLPATATALLVETRAASEVALHEQITDITKQLAPIETLRPCEFTDKPEEYTLLWQIRKGLFPAVGAVRESGTTVIIEDVAFPITRLADAAIDLQQLFAKYQYHEAIIFGHALEGNLHFVFTQDFARPEEVTRYEKFMDDVVSLVVDKYDGSLKAEHGTGRNMAPFVEKEWGAVAYSLMQEIKKLFDPQGLLNPGVILNDDRKCHVDNLKTMPAANVVADKCIECGFCEPVCPSKDLTLTPRQRIAGRREIARKMAAAVSIKDIRSFVRQYRYPGMDTCAADGLCATRCPVGIDTGKMVKGLREEANGPLAEKIAGKVADNFDKVGKTISGALNVVDAVHKMTGTRFMQTAAEGARKATFTAIPLWNKEMPRGVAKIVAAPVNHANPNKVVYFPSCASRSMSGPARDETERRDLPQVTIALLAKAGYEIIYPDRLDHLCCGQAFESKGFLDIADKKSTELSAALLAASSEGEIPILCDTSPCLYRMKATVDARLKLYEPIEFVLNFLMDKLKFTRKKMKIAVHPTCSTRKMGLEKQLVELAEKCVEEVVWPDNIYCCGFAGDRGFNFPELNKAALYGLKDQVQECQAGYSTSKTCEIGLSLHGEIPYRSILYLVDESTSPK